jgi:hypothetical protein
MLEWILIAAFVMMNGYEAASGIKIQTETPPSWRFARMAVASVCGFAKPLGTPLVNPPRRPAHLAPPQRRRASGLPPGGGRDVEATHVVIAAAKTGLT